MYYHNSTFEIMRTASPLTPAAGKPSLSDSTKAKNSWGLSLNERLQGLKSTSEKPHIIFVSFELLEEDDFNVRNPSSCLVQPLRGSNKPEPGIASNKLKKPKNLPN